MELLSHYRVPYLYMKKFMLGSTSLYREYLFKSPSYTGDKAYSVYPKYSPHTLDTLENVIEHANRCIELTRKRYFRQTYYNGSQEVCQLLKNTAKYFLPLETKILNLLAVEPCAKDLVLCQEHSKIFMEKMGPSSVRMKEKIREIFSKYYQENKDSGETASDDN